MSFSIFELGSLPITNIEALKMQNNPEALEIAQTFVSMMSVANSQVAGAQVEQKTDGLENLVQQEENAAIKNELDLTEVFVNDGLEAVISLLLCVDTEKFNIKLPEDLTVDKIMSSINTGDFNEITQSFEKACTQMQDRLPTQQILPDTDTAMPQIQPKDENQQQTSKKEFSLDNNTQSLKETFFNQRVGVSTDSTVVSQNLTTAVPNNVELASNEQSQKNKKDVTLSEKLPQTKVGTEVSAQTVVKPQQLADVEVSAQTVAKPQQPADVEVPAQTVAKPQQPADVEVSAQTVVKPQQLADVEVSAQTVVKPQQPADVEVSAQTVVKPQQLGDLEVSEQTVVKPHQLADVEVSAQTVVKPQQNHVDLPEKLSNKPVQLASDNEVLVKNSVQNTNVVENADKAVLQSDKAVELQTKNPIIQGNNADNKTLLNTKIVLEDGNPINKQELLKTASKQDFVSNSLPVAEESKVKITTNLNENMQHNSGSEFSDKEKSAPKFEISFIRQDKLFVDNMNLQFEVSNAKIKQSVTEQVKNALVSNIDKPNSEIVLQLEPADLGKVVVKLSVVAGAVTAQLLAEKASTQAVLSDQLVNLKETLQINGINLQNITVTNNPQDMYSSFNNSFASQNSYGQNQQNNHNQNGGFNSNADTQNNQPELISNEIINLQMFKANRINYSI